MQGISNKPALTGIGRALPATPPSTGVPPLRALIFVVGALLLCFLKPLIDLARLSSAEDIYSHLLLIPCISAYLIWQIRAELPKPQRGPLYPTFAAAIVPLGLTAVPYLLPNIGAIEILSARILALWMLLLLAVFALQGPKFFRAIRFPLLFMIFFVPLPPSIIHPLETASKIASAEAFALMMDLSQSTYFRRDFIFMLPGLTIEVAQECSGIRSSLVLFIVSILAAHLFLTTTWKRVLFALFVIPLGIVRNGFRIFTLCTLSVHWDPSVIHGPIHHRGGPIFFALSLIPFFLVLFWLRKTEQPKPGISAAAHRS